jgi:transcriptional regulator with XRE-family HTH domain
MFPNLKVQIFRRCGHQNKLAKVVGIDETVLSKIIHGYRDPTVSQRKILAAYLEADEAWLFERFEAAQAFPSPGQVLISGDKNKSGDGNF